MEFGDRNRFGVTLDLDENYGGVWLLGKICYWIKGEMVGNYDEGTSLGDVLSQMVCVVGDCGKRFCPALIGLKKETVFHLIDAIIYDGSEEIYRYVSPEFLPERLDVCIHVDVFDSWKVFLIDGEVQARILYCKMGSAQIEESVLGVGEFDRVLVEVHRYLDKIYERELNREGDLKWKS